MGVGMTAIGTDLLNRRCTIRRPVRVEGTGGRWSTSEQVHARAVPCRKSEPSMRDVEIASRRLGEISAVFYFLPGQDVRREDVAELDGAAYEVLGVTGPNDVYTKAWVSTRQPGVV